MGEETITIDWVRHAESVANLLEGQITDTYFSKMDEEKWNLYINNLKKIELEDYDRFFNREIVEGIDELKKSDNYTIKLPDDPKAIGIKMKFDKMKDDIKKFDLDEFHEIDNRKDFVTNYLSLPVTNVKKKWPGTWLFTPTLSYNGIRQAILFGKEYLVGPKVKEEEPIYDLGVESREGEYVNVSDEEEQNDGSTLHKFQQYNLIICSPTVRTIMTALYSIMSAMYAITIPKGKLKIQIYIVPYINEIYNGAGSLDRSNAAIPYEIIDDVINYIIHYIIENIQILFPEQKEKFSKEQHKTKFDLFKSMIDVSHYIKEMALHTDQLTKFAEGDYKNFIEGDDENNIESYLSKFLSELKLTNNNGLKILAFSHGKVIQEEIKKDVDKDIKDPFFPNNCSVWQVNYKKKKDNKGYVIQKYGNPPNTDEILTLVKANQFTRETQIGSEGIAKDIFEGNFPLPAYLGAFCRTNLESFSQEITNGYDLELCSLSGNSLRGKINRKWIKSERQKSVQTGGGRGKKNTRKILKRKQKNRKHTKKNKRTQKKRRSKKKTHTHTQNKRTLNL